MMISVSGGKRNELMMTENYAKSRHLGIEGKEGDGQKGENKKNVRTEARDSREQTGKKATEGLSAQAFMSLDSPERVEKRKEDERGVEGEGVMMIPE